jgi:hypothetical protein
MRRKALLSVVAAIGLAALGLPLVTPAPRASADTGEWSQQTVPPAYGGILDSISCATASFCSAVGYASSGPLAYTFDGTSWTADQFSSTQSATTRLLAVSCPTPAECVAVGSDDANGVIEEGNGGTWTSATNVAWPAGSGSLSSVSCPTPTFCLAAGNWSTGAPGTVLEAFNGSRWGPIRGPNIPTALNNGYDYTVSGISCLSATYCVIAGNAIVPWGETPFVETSDGRTWTAGTLDSDDIVGAVTCVLTNFCIIAGGSQIGRNQTLEMGSGSTWNKVPAGSPVVTDGLTGVSCSSWYACTSVGPGVVDQWDGLQWTAAAINPVPVDPLPGMPAGALAAVGCPSVGTCEAVGVGYPFADPEPAAAGWLASAPLSPPATPTLSSLSPASGPSYGGSHFTLAGTGLSTDPALDYFSFGGAAATGIQCSSSMTCTGVTPPGYPGTVPLGVWVLGRPSSPSPAGTYVYTIPPGCPKSMENLFPDSTIGIAAVYVRGCPGYLVANSYGEVSGFGAATADYSNVWVKTPIVAIEATADAGGYWLLGADGGVTGFGDAGYFGSLAGVRLAAPAVGMAATPDGKGYWIVAKDGGVFSFGDARFHGSTGAVHLNAPVIGMAVAPGGSGYWLVASDGGVFTFTPDGFYGSLGGIHLRQPVVGMSSTPDGRGYTLVASDGGVFNFGDSRFYGSLGNHPPASPVVDLSPAEGDDGYYLVDGQSQVFSFGPGTYRPAG